MTPIAQMAADELKRFIHERVSGHPRFRSVIAVSVAKYPTEFFATVWVAQEPDLEMRQYAYELEAELANLGVPCSLLVKTDRELPFGGTYRLRTSKGEFSFRYSRIDAVRDEDFVYAFAVYHGPNTYHFRLSLTRTLASMLRHRQQLDEERVLEIYRTWIREWIERDDVVPDLMKEQTFDSRDVSLFAGA